MCAAEQQEAPEEHPWWIPSPGMRELVHEVRLWELREAYRELVTLRRQNLDFTKALEVEVFAPVCEPCYAYERNRFEMEDEGWELPAICSATWRDDLRWFGVTRDELRRIYEDSSEVRCRSGGESVSYRGENVYVRSISFEDYFPGLLESDNPANAPERVKQLILDAYSHRCFGCARPLTRRQVTFDHITPRSAEGRATLANLQPLCTECNNRKKDMLPETTSYHLHFPLVPPPSDAYDGVTW